MVSQRAYSWAPLACASSIPPQARDCDGGSCGAHSEPKPKPSPAAVFVSVSVSVSARPTRTCERPCDICEKDVRSCEGGGRASPTEESSRRTHPGMQVHRSRSEAPQLRADPPPDPSPPRSSQQQQQQYNALTYRRTTATRSRPPLTHLHPDAVRGRPSASHAKHEREHRH